MAALLQQPDILKNAYEDAQNAEGSAWRENEKYLDSIQGRMDLFTNSVQTMWSNTINDDAVKWIVDLGTAFIKFVDNLGLIKALIIAIGTYINMKYLKIDFLKLFGFEKLGNGLAELNVKLKEFGASTIKTFGKIGSSIGSTFSVSNIQGFFKTIAGFFDTIFGKVKNLGGSLTSTFKGISELRSLEKEQTRLQSGYSSQRYNELGNYLMDAQSDIDGSRYTYDEISQYSDEFDKLHQVKTRLEEISIRTQELRDGMGGLGKAIYNTINLLDKTFSSLGKGIKSAYGSIENFFSKIQKSFNSSLNKVREYNKSMTDTFKAIKKLRSLSKQKNNLTNELTNNSAKEKMLLNTLMDAQSDIDRSRYSSEEIDQYIKDYDKILKVRDAISETDTKIKNIYSGLSKTGKSIYDAINNFELKLKNVVQSLKPGNLANQLKNVISNIDGFVSNVFKRIQTITNNSIKNIGQSVNNLFNNIKTSISGIIPKTQETLKSLWSSIKSAKIFKNPQIDSIRNQLMSAQGDISGQFYSYDDIQKLSDQYDDAQNMFKNARINIANSVKFAWDSLKSIDVSKMLGNIMNNISTTFSNIFNNIQTSLGNVFSSVKTTMSNVSNVISNEFNNIQNTAKSIFNTVGNKFNSIGKSIKSFFISPNRELLKNQVLQAQEFGSGYTIDEIDSLIAEYDKANSVFQTVKGNIQTALDSVFTPIKNTFGHVTEVISGAFTKIQTNVGKISTTIQNTFSNLKNSIKTSKLFSNPQTETLKNQLLSADSLGNAGYSYDEIEELSRLYDQSQNMLRNMFINIGSYAKNLFSTVKTTFQNIGTTVKSTMTNAFSAAKLQFENFINLIKNVDLKSVFTNIGNSISNTFKSIWDSVSKGFSSLYTSISGGFKSFANNLKSFGNKVKSSFDKGFSGIKEGLQKTFNPKGYRQNLINQRQNLFSQMEPIRGLMTRYKLEIENAERNGDIDSANKWGSRYDALYNAVGEKLRNLETEFDKVGNKLENFTNKTKKSTGIINNLKTSLGNLPKTLAKVGQGLAKMASSMLAMWVMSEIMSLIKSGIDALITTVEEHLERYDDLVSQLNQTKSAVESLETELESIEKQINEINKNKLSFTDKEDLERLKAERDELEYQLNTQKELQKMQQKAVNASTPGAINDYKSIGTVTGNTTGENIAKGAMIGTGAGALAAVMAAEAASGPIGWAALLITAIGAAVGVGIGAIVSATEDKIGESLENYQENVSELQEKINEAKEDYYDDPTSKSKREDYEEAEQALAEYKQKAIQYYTEMDQKWQNTDLSVETGEGLKLLKEQKQAFYDDMDKFLIDNKSDNAKTNAFDRIFGEDAFDDIKTVKEKFLKELENGNDNISLEEMFYGPDGFEKFKKRLLDMGLSVYEAEQYLKDYKEEIADEDNNIDLTDTATSINNVTDGLEELKNAFDEVSETGQITAKTLKSLYDTIGQVSGIEDAWQKYVNVMMSGVASTKEMKKATEELVEEYLDRQFDGDALTSDEYIASIAALYSLGLSNPKEYLDDRNMESAITAAAERYGTKKSRKKELEAIKEEATGEDGNQDPTKWNEELEKELTDLEDLNPQQVLEDIFKEYKIDYDTEDLEKYVNILKELADVQKQLEDASSKNKAFTDWNKEFNGSLDVIEILGLDKDWKTIVKEIRDKHGFDTTDEFNFSDFVYENGSWVRYKDGKMVEGYSDREYSNFMNLYSAKNGHWEDIFYDGQWSQSILELLTPEQRDLFEEYAPMMSQYVAAIEEGKNKGYFEIDENGNIKTDENGKYIIKPEFADYEGEVDRLQKQMDGLMNELETEYTADIQVQLDLINASGAVDEIQEVYDTLNSAMEEYREQGYFNADTVQSLLDKDGKYIDLLYDENGQLNLNEESLYKVAQARLYNLGLQKLEAIGTEALNVAQKGSVDKMNDLIKVYDSASDSMTDYIATQKEAIIVALNARNDLTQEQKDSFVNGIESQMNAVYKTTMSAVNNIRGAISSSGKSSSETAKDEFDKIVAKFERELNLISHEKDLIQAEIDKTEARGEIASVSYYERLIELEEMQKQKLIEKKEALEDYLKTHEKSVDKATWAEMNGEIQDTALAIKDCEKNIIDFGQAIEDVHWSYFEKANDEVNGLADEIQWLNSLLEDTKDVADENGNWSSNAITQLGLYVQQMEYAAAMTKRYGEEINNVDAAWKEYQQLLTQYGDSNNIPNSAKEQLTNKYNILIQSESEYQEKLKELEDAQHSAIDSYKDAKDGIVSLNEARVDAIKDGIDKEIDAYKELIDLKKEELDAEKDLYDFKKNVEKQTKDISELERKISSLSGSTSDADIAERRKLEAQLKESQEGLNDTYYDHAKEAQSNALDEEMEAYQDARDKYIEQLDEMLKDVEQLIQDTLMDVLFNADLISQELIILEQTYGITLSEELKKPWQDASTQATAWKDELQESMTSGEYAALIGEGGAITVFSNQVGQKLKGSWDQAKNGVKEYADFLNGTELKDRFTSTLTGFGNQIQSIIDKWKGVKKAAEQAAQAQIEAASGEYTIGGIDGNGNPGGGPDFDPTTPEKQKKRYYKYKKIGSYYFYECGSDASGNSYSGYYIRRSNRIPYGAKLVSTAEETLYTYRQNSNQMVAARQKNGETKKHPVIYCGVNGYVEEYAKGTISTKKDQWAITDEPQWGDELTLVPGKDGNLSFMRKGTGVVPAKLTERIMELAMQNPSDMSGTIVKPIVSDIKTNANAINVNFEALVKADNITNDVLPEVEKIVSKQLDKFTRSLNYSLRKVGAN